MKSALIIINTYSQLLTAIQIKKYFFNTEDVDVIITDQTKNTKSIAGKLSDINYFNKVLWIQNCDVCSERRNILNKIYSWFYVLFGWKVKEITTKTYDELLFFNPDIFVHGVYSMLKKNNSKLVCSRYEEGILSYTDSRFLNDSRLNYANIIRSMFGKSCLESDTKQFYCFYPNFYKGVLKTVEIPQISENKYFIGKLLAEIFGINDNDLCINEKYIFFTSVFDFEGSNPIGEYELVKKVAEIVGRDNLIIKTHPRDKRTVYIDSGLKIYKNSFIPWEAIQLNNDFSDKVLLTVNSSSVLTVNMMVKKKARALFLYKCCHYEVNDEAIELARYLENLLGRLEADSTLIMENLTDFENYVSKGD